MSQFVGDALPQAILAPDDTRALPVRWRRVWATEPSDLRWPRSRLDGAQGWLESTWYEWPVIFAGTGQPVPFVYSITPTVSGTAPSRPVYTLTLPATDYTISQVYVVNESFTPDSQLTITRAFYPGDVISIDCDSFEVTVNSTPADFSGQFPLLDPRLGATNTIKFYAVAADTPTLTPTIAWTPRFLS